MGTYNIAVLPGDGIGPEVIGQGMRVLEKVRETAQGIEAVDTLIYTEVEIERIVRTAFELARGRRKRLTSVDKANVLSSSRLWRGTVDRVAAEYADVSFGHLLVDTCAMQLIR